MNNQLENIKVRATSIISNEHPEWGTWGIYEDQGDWFVIRGDRGSRILNKSEFVKFWHIVNTLKVCSFCGQQTDDYKLIPELDNDVMCHDCIENEIDTWKAVESTIADYLEE